MKRKLFNFSKNNFNNIKKSINRYLSSNILFLSYVLCSMLIGIILRINTVSISFDIKPYAFDLIAVIIIGSFGYLFKPKNQIYYFMFFICLFCFLGIMNNIYYKFYQSFVSVNLLSTATMLSDVGDSVLDKLEVIHFMYLFAPLAIIIIHNKLNKKSYYIEVSKYEKKFPCFRNTLIVGIILLVIMCFTLTKVEMSRFVKQWNREYIVQKFGIYTYTLNDLVQSVEPKIDSLFGLDEATKKFRDFYTEKEKTFNENSKNKFTNIYKGKNVIFIHGESIQNFLIDLTINGEEVTPNLNKLSKSGIYFSKFYPQISVGTSSDTEFTLSTGLMPSSTGTVFVSYSNRTYSSMQNKFKSLGYYTFSMHANNADYWNRKVMHKNLGYDDFYAKDSYIINDDDIIGLGLNDKSFFAQSVEKLKEISENNEKFMGTIITLTNHSPFNDITKYGEFDVSMKYEVVDEDGNTTYMVADYLEGQDMGNYIKSAHYADEALGEFFNELDEAGLLENTVIVFYGDHESKLSKKQFNLLYNYDPYTGEIKDKNDPTYVNLDNYQYDLLKNTPLIIWTKDQSNVMNVADVMGMYDVFPTIGNMFGFNSFYSLGNDIFSDNEKIVIFPNGNFLTNSVYYNNLKDEYISFTSLPIDSTYIERLKKYAETRLEVSNGIIVHDLIKLNGSMFKYN